MTTMISEISEGLHATAAESAVCTAVERHVAIMSLLERYGAVRNSFLADTLGVTTNTIRRDMQLLARRGHITPVHGGAIITRYKRRQGGSHSEEDAIALRAVRLVKRYASIGLSAGTINTLIARSLARVPGLTVVTTSPDIAAVFQDHESQDQRIVLIGGVLGPGDGCVGSIALATIAQIHLDQLFLEVRGFDSVRGLRSPSHLEAEVDRALINAAGHLVVVANHTAWSGSGLAPLGPLAAADALVTGNALSAAAQADVRAVVGELHLVDFEPVHGHGRGF